MITQRIILVYEAGDEAGDSGDFNMKLDATGAVTV